MWYIINNVKEWRFAVEITVNGLKISYTDEGSGEVVLLLHGWGAKKELFTGVTSVISEKYRAVALDLPGFGDSEEPPFSWDVDGFADFVTAFIVAMGFSRVILLGHSFGGRIIIKLCARRNLPFEISRVILAGSAGVLPKRGLSYKLKVGSYKFMKKCLSLPPVKKLFPNALENSRKKKGSADYAAASPVMRGTLVRAVNEDLTPIFKDNPYDTLLIWGSADDATPLSDGKIMESLMSQAGLAEIPGAGHYSWLDSPALFTAIIRSYLGI